jgi:hypothetical protein
MRPSGKLKRFMSNADYQVSTKRTKKRIPRFVRVGAAKKADHVRQCDHDDVYVSIIERWALNVGRFTSAGNAEHPTSNVEFCNR